MARSNARVLTLLALLAIASTANAQLLSSLLGGLFKPWTSPYQPAPAPAPVPSPKPWSWPVPNPAPLPTWSWPVPTPKPAPIPSPVPVPSLTGVFKPGKWFAKTDPATYYPQSVDWAGLVSACRETVNWEKRIGNFWIRASFHDSMSVDVRDCVPGNPNANGPACGGLDASNMLSIEEMTRPENAYDNFTLIAARASVKIASWYGASMADTLAICAAVSIEYHSKDRVKILGADGLANFRVGRIDRLAPTPPGLLPPADAKTPEFAKFFVERGFEPAQGAALLGSHSLIDEQECDMGPGKAKCDPTWPGSCRDVRMFQWDNHYFQDICTPRIEVSPKDPKVVDPADMPVDKMPLLQFLEAKKAETCKFTSDLYRGRARKEMDDKRAGLRKDVDTPQLWSVDWFPNNGPKKHWFYTINDGFLGKLCQNNNATLSDDPVMDGYLKNLRDAMQQFKANQGAWDKVLVPTYLQMCTVFAKWSTTTAPLYIRGNECASAWTADNTCALKAGLYGKINCGTCAADGTGSCHSCCRCGSQFLAGISYKPNPIRDLSNLLSYKLRWDSRISTYTDKWLDISKAFSWLG